MPKEGNDHAGGVGNDAKHEALEAVGAAPFVVFIVPVPAYHESGPAPAGRHPRPRGVEGASDRQSLRRGHENGGEQGRRGETHEVDEDRREVGEH